jgi:hypothetical protein
MKTSGLVDVAAVFTSDVIVDEILKESGKNLPRGIACASKSGSAIIAGTLKLYLLPNIAAGPLIRLDCEVGVSFS